MNAIEAAEAAHAEAVLAEKKAAKVKIEAEAEYAKRQREVTGRDALDAAEVEHAKAQEAARIAAERVEVAKREAAIAELRKRRAARFEEMRKLGSLIGTQALMLVDAVLEAREKLAADEADTKDLAALGVDGTATDGLPLAFGIGRELLVAKVPLRASDGAKALRWAAAGLLPRQGEAKALEFLTQLMSLARQMGRRTASEDDVQAEIDSWAKTTHYGECVAKREVAPAPRAPVVGMPRPGVGIVGQAGQVNIGVGGRR